MRGRGAVLAVAGVIDHQHPSLVRGDGRVLAQQPHPLVVDALVIPGRLREEPLQPLDLARIAHVSGSACRQTDEVGATLAR
jgi:hypothetical protein